MRKFFIPIAASVLAGAVACADSPTETSSASSEGALFSAPGETEAGFAPITEGGNISGDTVERVCFDGLSEHGIDLSGIDGLLHAKADWRDGEWQHKVNEEWVAFSNDHVTFTTDGAPGKFLDFDADGWVYAVVVKGGPGFNLYDYTEDGIGSDSHLHSPLNNGGNVPNISHVNFCYVPAAGTGAEGCGQGFWANHDGSGPQENEWPAGYAPGDALAGANGLFEVGGDYHENLRTATLREALLGGNLPSGQNENHDRAANNLFRHAVAAVLNAAHDDVDFTYQGKTGSDAVDAIIAAVNDVLAERDVTAINELKDELEALNDADCPLDGDE